MSETAEWKEFRSFPSEELSLIWGTVSTKTPQRIKWKIVTIANNQKLFKPSKQNNPIKNREKIKNTVKAQCSIPIEKLLRKIVKLLFQLRENKVLLKIENHREKEIKNSIQVDLYSIIFDMILYYK